MECAWDHMCMTGEKRVGIECDEKSIEYGGNSRRQNGAQRKNSVRMGSSAMRQLYRL